MNFSEETIHDRAVGFLLVFTQRNSKCGSKETLWAILIPKSNLELLLCIYNMERESMKYYKCFFYQYSGFHVFTRQSSVENVQITT